LKLSKLLPLFFLITMVLMPLQAVKAQDQPAAEAPVYIVQAGDTLYDIAIRFGVSQNDIIQLNQITDANLVSEGTELRIPGLEGMSGVLTTTVIPLGQTMRNLLRQYQMPDDLLVKINRITSPIELFAGANLILLQPESQTLFSPRGTLATGDSILNLAAANNVNPWTLVLDNGIDNPNTVIPGEQLFSASANQDQPELALSPLVESITIAPLPLVQGSTADIHITTDQELTLTGTLNGLTLNFFPVDDGYVALQGIHAMATPGPVQFEVTATAANNTTFSVQQNVLLAAGNFAYSPSIPVDPATIDETNTKPEDEQVRQLIAPVTQVKQWDGPFLEPIDVPAGYTMVPDCRTDSFGNRRSYNNGPYNSFHTGIDLSKCGLPGEIYAPAAGTVVFSGSLVVRGNYTVIDHGWGVYTAYGHQSESFVKAGDHVEAGQLIGMIGDTGRVDGPHLHWEVWVNGVLVQPLDWIYQTYP
jgi:murein DD-endopeptidase MepM/ murein hydrolase activator NlpD